MGYNSTPKPFQPYSERSPQLTHVKSPASSKSRLVKEDDEPSQLASRTKETPKTAPKPPSFKPHSAHLMNREQKTFENTSNTPSSARSGVTTSTTVSHTPRQYATPARPQPASAQVESEVVQMRPKVRKSIDDEPTAHSVSARMSAWEHMSSAQEVSNIKKVKPGDSSPVKSFNTVTPMVKNSPLRASVRGTPSKGSTVTPSKSFKDSIKERAKQVNPVTAAEADSGSSPNKGQSLSPKKASNAMKAVQQQLVQQTQSTSMAERLRQERMAELQMVQDRWKNGILRESDDDDKQEEV